MTAGLIILKILLYILLAVLGLVVLLLFVALWFPVTADVSFIGGEFKYKANFSFIKLIDSDGKGFLKRKKKKKSTEISNNEDDIDFEDIEDFPEYDDTAFEIPEDYSDTDEDIPEETDEMNERSEKIRKIKENKSEKSNEQKSDNTKSIFDKIESFINLLEMGGRPLLRTLKGFRLKNVYIDFIVTNENAYICAMNYGHVCNVVYNGLAWISEVFTVSYKTVDIQCGFSLDKSQWDASCKVSFRFYNLVIAGIWFLITYIFKIFIPKKLKRKK